MNKAKVLVVDDEPDILRLVKFTLERYGYEVITANDGKSGVEKALSENPAIVLMDAMMPIMDGFEACKKLKEKNQTMPIVMLSAKSQQTEVQKGFEAGADGYIVKPFTSKGLLAQVEEMIKND